MPNRAWVTLATNDSYGLGALVLAYSLRRVETTYPSVVLITPSVTEPMRNRLHAVFAEVITVDVLDSRDAAHLALLQRPELGITFTKIHCWNLTQYEKCVFLDADTLVVQNSDELFEREELSAAPDVGWPDCFNSGVFVYKPSKETFDALIQFAQERGSFDGGDQGLLNSYFSDWAHGDISKHLPFLYNVTSAAFYSYLPALKHFGQNLKIIHFIGANKPWLQPFNWESRSVDAPGHLEALLQLWWDLFVSSVHPQLDTAMVEVKGPPTTPPRDITQHYEPSTDAESEFSWHHPQSDQPQESLHIDTIHFHDPWENYRGNVPPPEKVVNAENFNESNRDIRNYAWEYKQEHIEHVYHTNVLTHPSNIWQQPSRTDHHHEQYQGHVCHDNNLQQNPGNHSNYHVHHQQINDGQHNESHNSPEKTDPQYQVHHHFHEITNGYSSNHSRVEDSNWNVPHNIINVTQDILGVTAHHIPNGFANGEGEGDHNEDNYDKDIRPRHPYDGYYLKHQPTVDVRGRKVCLHELPTTPPPSPPSNTVSDFESSPDSQSGVAGNLARVTPGPPNAQRDAIDELTRRQGWEAGNIDYMGADSFANIWAKISQTLAAPRTSPPKQTSPPREQAVAKESTPPRKQPTPPPKQPTPPKKQPTPPPKQPTPPPKQASPPKEVQKQEVVSAVSTDTTKPVVEVAKVEQESSAPSVIALSDIPTQESVLPEVPAPTTPCIKQPPLESSVVPEQTVVASEEIAAVPQQIPDVPVVVEAAAVPATPSVEVVPTTNKVAPTFAEVASKPAEVAPTPAEVAPTPAEVASTPTEVAPRPVEVAPTPAEVVVSTPPVVAPTPAEVAPTSAEVAAPPAEVAPTPAEVAPTPAQVASTPAEVASTPAEVAPTPTEVASTPTEVAPKSAEVAPTPVETAPTPAIVAPTPAVVAPTPDVVAPTPDVVAPTPAVIALTSTEAAPVSVETPTATTKTAPVLEVTEKEVPKPVEDTKVQSSVAPQAGATEAKAPEKTIEVKKPAADVPATKDSTEKVAVTAEPEKVVPVAETPSAPKQTEPILTPATPVLSSTPDKKLDLTTASTDSPPLANTPAKEEPDTAVQPPAAKSAEGRGKKLHLSAPAGRVADTVPTPDSELEDAAALAQSIIAGELATPTVTSPTPPVPLTPSSPAAPVDKRLSVDDTVPETPPAGSAGPVSLAQIGVKTKGKVSTAEQIAASIEKPQETSPGDEAASATPSEPTTPVKEEPAPKKKVVKKVVKKEGEAGPVPPPRKKEKKPK